ncbi:MAG: hypothetical protein L6R35_002459 [Caloplaca aegaea]|nr:MAG: hypothetical protein L6R35_002459 [Caloplaca aegaea]
MKSHGLPLLFVISSLLNGLLSLATAKPLTWSGSSTHKSNTIVIRDAITPNPTPDFIPPYRFAKRASSTDLPGGWTCNFGAELQAFDHISSASASLEAFYRWALNELNNGEHDDLLTRSLSISDGPFELVFRHRDPTLAVSLTMVRAFLTMMQQRSERGWAVRYAGWVEGPGGTVVDMILIVTSSILDSAMDMYGY